VFIYKSDGRQLCGPENIGNLWDYEPYNKILFYAFRIEAITVAMLTVHLDVVTITSRVFI